MTLNNYLFEIQQKKYRLGVDIFIKKADKLIFGYNKNRNVYVLCGGGIDNSETAIQAAKRETLEELGIEIHNIEMISKKPVTFGWDKKLLTKNELTDKTKDRMAKYSGQSKFMVFGEFLKINKSLWNVDGDGMDIKEFSINQVRKMFNKAKLTYNKTLYDYRLKMLDIIEKKYFINR